MNVEHLHKAEKRVLKYFNKIQREAMVIQAHNEYFVCARGTGKSEGLDARFILRNVWAMPGSMGALISPTYAKAWGNTVPAICHALSTWGYMQNIHYFVGRQAPKKAGFKLPKRIPLQDAWSNCIHFWNGTILIVLSLNNGMSANSMSLDWVIGPEAKFLNYEKIKNEINPANRGNLQYFDYSPWHHSEMYTTDMPTSRTGKWILDKEKEMNAKHIDLIRYLYREKKLTERNTELSEVWRHKRCADLEKELAYARKFQPVEDDTKRREYTTFYGEYDIFDNLEVVGEDFIWQMKRDLPPLVFRTAMLNERLFKVANGFYSALEDKIHFYIAPEVGDGSAGDYIARRGCQNDGDYNEKEPIHVAFDSNAAISTACVAQLDNEKRVMRTIRSFFVKTPRKLDQLVQDMCDHYSPSANRNVVVYYDHTFVWKTGNNSESYIETIQRIFEKNNYVTTLIYIGQAPRHDWKHTQIDMALKGSNELFFPVFNEMNNEYLRIAMNRAGVKLGRNGFEKDKSEERLDDSPDCPDETKTHITDAWDTLFLGCNFFFSGISSGGAFAFTM